VLYDACWTVIPSSLDIGTYAGFMRDDPTDTSKHSLSPNPESWQLKTLWRTLTDKGERRHENGDVDPHQVGPVLNGTQLSLRSVVFH
jgi:hypothetical protein